VPRRAELAVYCVPKAAKLPRLRSVTLRSTSTRSWRRPPTSVQARVSLSESSANTEVLRTSEVKLVRLPPPAISAGSSLKVPTAGSNSGTRRAALVLAEPLEKRRVLSKSVLLTSPPTTNLWAMPARRPSYEASSRLDR